MSGTEILAMLKDLKINTDGNGYVGFGTEHN
jgi:hypothetical protein